MPKFYGKFLTGAGLFAGCLLFFASSALSLLQTNRVLVLDLEAEPAVSGFQARGVTGEEAFRKEGASLALDFDVTTPQSLLYFSVPIRAAQLSEMRYLSFWMKIEGAKPVTGRLGTPKAEFWVEAREGDERVRVRGRAFSRRRNIEGWEKFVIPLERFRAVASWDRVTEIRFLFRNLSRLSPGKAAFDDFIFGSVYPDRFNGEEISMQNRVSSFKIARGIADREMKLKSSFLPVTLTLTFIDPYLEEVRFEESRDEGGTWRRIESFYDHQSGGVYETTWEIRPRPRPDEAVLVRAVGMNLFGGEAALAGPYRVSLD